MLMDANCFLPSFLPLCPQGHIEYLNEVILRFRETSVQ